MQNCGIIVTPLSVLIVSTVLMHSKSTILAIDTATDHCSVALRAGGKVYQLEEHEPREHSRKLLPMIEAVLKQAGLALQHVDLIGYARGPGSFTGLRIGISAVQGLAFGADIPTAGVSTLACQVMTGLSTGVVREGDRVVSMLDARMNEIYWASYDIVNGFPVAATAEQVCGPADWSTSPSVEQRNIGVGSGWRYRDAMDSKLVEDMSEIRHDLGTTAAAVLALVPAELRGGAGDPAELAQPIYVRDTINWKKRGEQGKKSS
ncbi:MAG: tRNA threonylcarbamoyladenosine biosynthesis protein TsaB [Halieaceae bacterium]|jgi:tRNA threonylcarbamoyladenosine biosynthesis protein TsaB